MGRIKQVKIGSVIYKVRRKRQLPDTPDGRQTMGEYDPVRGEIRLKSHMPADTEFQCLWHEVVHGILDVAGQADGLTDDQVDLIAHGVARVLRDNPEMGIQGVGNGESHNPGSSTISGRSPDA